jgi:hypothetical protein
VGSVWVSVIGRGLLDVVANVSDPVTVNPDPYFKVKR